MLSVGKIVLNCVVQNGKSQRLGGPKSEAAEPGGRALGRPLGKCPPSPHFLYL